jgi:PAS domain S-box-containing protein
MRGLCAKFLLHLIPVFIVITAAGIAVFSYYDQKSDGDALAARMGNNAARLANSLAAHNAHMHPMMARDLIRYLSVDRALLCAEYRATTDNSLIAATPAHLGCTGTTEGYRLTIPVGSKNKQTLLVVFSDAELVSAANTRRAQQLILIAAAFVIALVSAVIGFRQIVSKPLARLRQSIQRITETGERVPVTAPAGDQLGEIVGAFNEMLERESEREMVLERANKEIQELNHTLEARVQKRTGQLLDSESRLHQLIESFGSGIYIHADFEPLYANRTLLEMLGFDGLDDFLSIQTTKLLLAPDERERIWGYHQARLAGGTAPTDYDFWALKKSGEKLRVNNRSFVVDWNGRQAVCTTLFDLTARQMTEQSLAEQQQLMNSILSTTHEGFWFIDLDKRTTDVNPAMCKILDRPREEIIGRSIMDFVDDANAQIFRDQITRRSTGDTTSYEISLSRPDGTGVVCLNNATPLLTTDGERFGSVGIWTDISEIKMTQRSLENEKERAEAANIAKSEFLAIASHELRTPMNGVLGMAGLLKATDLTDGQQERVEMISRSGEALLGLLNEILDISKIEAGKLEIESREFGLRAMIDGVAALMGSRAKKTGVDYESVVATDVPDTLIGDQTRIRQVLINIVGNAVKFTASGSIGIRVFQKPLDEKCLELHFEITDTGSGIELDAQQRIFEKFTQADSSTTRRYGGTGLGLAISKELVELMGGEIGVTSSPGLGSRFWFTINVGAGKERDMNPCAPEQFSTAAANRQRPLRVLVAEDNKINQAIARETLTNAGHRVDVVENGFAALAAVQNAAYDVILMDVHMPEMDGLTATGKIRELPGPQSDIPVIALTADAMVGDREKFMDAGMNEYISKPFDTAELFSTIERLVDAAGTADSQTIGPVINIPATSQHARTAQHAQASQPSHVLDSDIVGPLRTKKPDLWNKLVRLYLESTPKSLAALSDAIADDRPNDARMAAHTMKSSSANMGALRFAELCSAMEIAAEGPKITPCRDLLADIESEYEAVSAALAQETVNAAEPDRTEI